MPLTDAQQMLLFSLIFMRMSGFVLLNPIFGRRNIPMLVKGGMTIILTLTVYSFSAGEVPEISGTLDYSLLLLKEFAIGYMVGYVMQVFDSVLTFAGHIIDFQQGMSMAQVYDPQNNSQIAITGNLWQIFYSLLFFAVDGHLALMKILLTSYQVVPYGQIRLAPAAYLAILEMFKDCMALSLKFAMPIVAIEFLTEIAVGILMKMIPQINVFVVNIQAKIVIGFSMIFLLFTPMSDFAGNIIGMMLRAIQTLLRLL